MRPYIYMMLITFDMKLSKIFKNALIFAALGIKRNLMWMLGVVVVVVLNFMLIIVCPPSIIIPIILPFFYLWAFTGFTVNYAIYPIIQKYMIDPVLHQRGGSGNQDDVHTDGDDDDDNNSQDGDFFNHDDAVAAEAN
jgi:hypothetical protein